MNEVKKRDFQYNQEYFLNLSYFDGDKVSDQDIFEIQIGEKQLLITNVTKKITLTN